MAEEYSDSRKELTYLLYVLTMKVVVCPTNVHACKPEADLDWHPLRGGPSWLTSMCWSWRKKHSKGTFTSCYGSDSLRALLLTRTNLSLLSCRQRKTAPCIGALAFCQRASSTIFVNFRRARCGKMNLTELRVFPCVNNVRLGHLPKVLKFCLKGTVSEEKLETPSWCKDRLMQQSQFFTPLSVNLP